MNQTIEEEKHPMLDPRGVDVEILAEIRARVGRIREETKITNELPSKAQVVAKNLAEVIGAMGPEARDIGWWRERDGEYLAKSLGKEVVGQMVRAEKIDGGWRGIWLTPDGQIMEGLNCTAKMRWQRLGFGALAALAWVSAVAGFPLASPWIAAAIGVASLGMSVRADFYTRYWFGACRADTVKVSLWNGDEAEANTIAEILAGDVERGMKKIEASNTGAVEFRSPEMWLKEARRWAETKTVNG